MPACLWLSQDEKQGKVGPMLVTCLKEGINKIKKNRENSFLDIQILDIKQLSDVLQIMSPFQVKSLSIIFDP